MNTALIYTRHTHPGTHEVNVPTQPRHRQTIHNQYYRPHLCCPLLPLSARPAPARPRSRRMTLRSVCAPCALPPPTARPACDTACATIRPGHPPTRPAALPWDRAGLPYARIYRGASAVCAGRAGRWAAAAGASGLGPGRWQMRAAACDRRCFPTCAAVSPPGRVYIWRGFSGYLFVGVGPWRVFSCTGIAYHH